MQKGFASPKFQTKAGVAPILIILLIAILGIAGYFVYTNYSNNQTNSVPAPISYSTPKSSSSIDETTNWKTYSNSDIELQFNYPPNWNIKDSKKPSEEISEDIELSGAEGKINITAWNEGYGGGCDENMHLKFQIFEKTQDICHWTENGIEYWNGMTKTLPTGYIMSINSQANPPAEKNRDMVLKILSTFKSTK